MKKIKTNNNEMVKINSCVSEETWEELTKISDEVGLPVTNLITNFLSSGKVDWEKEVMKFPYEKYAAFNGVKSHKVVVHLSKEIYNTFFSLAKKYHISNCKLMRYIYNFIVVYYRFNSKSENIKEIYGEKDDKERYFINLPYEHLNILKNIAKFNDITLSKLAVYILTDNTSQLTINPNLLLTNNVNRLNNKKGTINAGISSKEMEKMSDLYSSEYPYCSITKMMRLIISNFVDTLIAESIVSTRSVKVDNEYEITLSTSNNNNRRYESREERIIKKDEVVKQICDVLSDNDDVNDIVVNVRFTKKEKIYNMYIKF